jgi:hypothetical protein
MPPTLAISTEHLTTETLCISPSWASGQAVPGGGRQGQEYGQRQGQAHAQRQRQDQGQGQAHAQGQRHAQRQRQGLA